MAHDSYAGAALRSFLPESRLIHARDFEGLFTQRRYRGAQSESQLERLAIILTARYWRPCRPDYTPAYRRKKFLNGLVVEGGAKSVVTARDPETGGYVQSGRRCATMLHLLHMDGPGHARQELGAATAYISANENLRETPFVIGTTFAELGRFATAIGFREFELSQIAAKYNRLLQIRHSVFCDLNGLENSYRPVVVGLPTPEFVERFSPPGEIPPLNITERH